MRRSERGEDVEALHVSKRAAGVSAMPPDDWIVPPDHDPLTDRFLLEEEVARITGLSRTTRWREARKGSFPKPRTLSAGRIGWLASEVRMWMSARAAAPQHQEATNVAP